jgi:hypothetical protein
VGGQHGAEVVAAGQNLNDARREELLSELAELQVTIGSEWRWLDDDWVSGKDRGTDLAASEVNWEVPWHNTNNKAERCVSLDGDLGVVFLDGLFLELELVEGSEPGGASGEFSLCELNLSLSVSRLPTYELCLQACLAP